MGPKLDAHASFIEEILTSDLSAPKKRRRTFLRLFERLRDERGFDGGFTTAADGATFSELSPTPFDACDKRPGKVSSQAPVGRKSADCLVPVVHAHPDVLAKGCVDAVAITVGADEIACHRRASTPRRNLPAPNQPAFSAPLIGDNVGGCVYLR